MVSDEGLNAYGARSRGASSSSPGFTRPRGWITSSAVDNDGNASRRS
jgi:hypothetical protein